MKFSQTSSVGRLFFSRGFHNILVVKMIISYISYLLKQVQELWRFTFMYVCTFVYPCFWELIIFLNLYKKFFCALYSFLPYLYLTESVFSILMNTLLIHGPNSNFGPTLKSITISPIVMNNVINIFQKSFSSYYLHSTLFLYLVS